jgi:hypothetical protein
MPRWPRVRSRPSTKLTVANGVRYSVKSVSPYSSKPDRVARLVLTNCTVRALVTCEGSLRVEFTAWKVM